MAYLNHFLNACLLAGAWFGMVPAIAAAQVADLVIHNARVLQCDAGMSQAEAIAIKDGRILAVGSEAEIQTLVAEGQTKVVNAANQCVTPGLTDSHLHFVGLGHSLQMLDLHAASEWQDIVDQVQQAARLLPKGSWIEGRGWHQSKWTSAPQENVDGYPDHTSLSAAVPDHPVLLTHASGHAVFANAAAMQLAGIGPDTSDPAGGEILRDETGRAIGVFRENAGGLIRRAQARAGERLSQTERVQQTRERVLLAAQACIAHGITSVHDAGSSFAEAQALRELAEDGQLPVRMTVMIREGSQTLSNRLPDFRWIGLADGFLTVRSIKVSIDGALGPHGAWLLEPYTDLATTSGLNTVNIDELERIARLCKEYDWQLCVHAIGDRANREVLDTYQRVLGSQAKSDHRWRVEHAQHLHPTDIPRFGQLGVIPAMQANHCTSDAIFVPARLGERRSAQGAYVWRALIDTGAMIPNGTDAPVERIDPRVSLYAAVTRQLPNGERFYPEQCMTRKEALLSYTLWPAYAAFQDDQLGSLSVGKRADMVMWDVDLLDCPAETLLDAQVRGVWIAGRQVFGQ